MNTEQLAKNAYVVYCEHFDGKGVPWDQLEEFKRKAWINVVRDITTQLTHANYFAQNK